MNIKIIFNPRWRIAAVLVLLGSAVTGCATVNYGAHHDETGSLDDNQSFALMADDSMVLDDNDRQSISPLERKIIIESIEEELTGKGFKYMEDPVNADFVVAYAIGMRNKTVTTSNRRRFWGPSSLRRAGRYFNKSKVKNRTYTEGTLRIDIFDGETKQLLWHGWASKLATKNDLNNPLAVNKKTVAAIISQFSPSN